MIRRAVRHIARVFSATAVAAIVLACGAAHAQTLFQPLTLPNTKSITLPAGTTPLGVAVADFNHDGFPDMVVANKADTSLGTTGTISVYLSSGPGTFSAATKYPTCGGPTAVLAQDLDLTGLQDIVITCNTPSSNVIEVFLNLGNGTFNPVVDGMTNIVLGTGLGPVSIVSGDFNEDGHPDLAVANSGDGTITLFLSNAANDFTYYVVQTLTGVGTPQGITAGKFNSTGHIGLAVTDSSTNTVHILLGDGTGDFAPIGSAPTQIDPTGITTGDFNHDGLTDLAVVNAGSGTVSILLGQGNGSFAPSTPVSVAPITGNGASAIITADIEGNGNDDLLVGNVLQDNVALLINRNNGAFQAAQDYTVPNGPAYLAIGDFNRDGKPDLAVTQTNGTAVSVLINNTLPTPQPGSINFVAPHTLANGRGNMADGVVAADFNHDGNPDIAATYLQDNAVRVVTGRGNGNFNTAVVYPVGQQPYWVATGDLNNDGYADLVTANTSLNSANGTVSVLMNNGGGTGTFAAAANYPAGRLPYQVAIGDLNGDGLPDLAVTNYGDNTVSILYGQPGGTFTGGQILATCANPYGVAIGDFRHTGQNDVAVTCFHTAQMEVFLNSGMFPFQPPPPQTTFESPEIFSTDSNPTSLVIADFNRDGNLDIVTGNSTANNDSFFAGNGAGGFAAGVISPSLNFPDSIAAGDVNGDGILDIVGVAPNYHQVVVTLGKGDGTFGTFLQRLPFASGVQPWAVALADFNLDGKLDIVTANAGNLVNLTIPAYQTMYMNQFPPTPRGGPSLNVLLNSSGTTITLATSPSGTVAYGQSVTLTATVTPTLGSTTPTGSVIFQDSNGASTGAIPLSGGSASFTTSIFGVGTHRITVLYSGDSLYQPNTETGPGFVVRVSGTPVALTLTPNPITPAEELSFSVTIGTAGPARQNPVGTITVFAILPNGTTEQIPPIPVGTPGTGGITVFSQALGTGVPVGNYYVYAVFTPAPGNPNPAGGSPQVLVISQ